MKIMISKVICIGEALVDQIISYPGRNCKNYLGGAPANVACALRKLGVETEYVGCLGDDKFGNEFINLFKELGVNIKFVQIDKNSSTRIIKVSIDKSGDRSFSGFVNSQKSFADEVLDRKLIESHKIDFHNLFKGTKYFITGTNILASTKSSETLFFLIKFAKKFKVSIVIDANWRNIFWDDLNQSTRLQKIDHIQKIKKFLENGNILKFSREEALLFFGTDNPSLISNLLSKKPDVIITNGDNPIEWFINGIQDKTQVLNSTKIVDTTGAGDSFLAGLISQFLTCKLDADKKTLNSYIQFASTCGLITCLGEGAIEPQPNIKKVQEFLKASGS